MKFIRTGPNVTIRSKSATHALQWLPREHDLPVPRSIEVCPEEGSRVARDLGRVHQHVQHPLGSIGFVQGKVRPLRISKRADEVEVRELEERSTQLAQGPHARRRTRLTILSWMLELGSAILGARLDGDASYGSAWIELDRYN